jgi:hypothetical protein
MYITAVCQFVINYYLFTYVGDAHYELYNLSDTYVVKT